MGKQKRVVSGKWSVDLENNITPNTLGIVALPDNKKIDVNKRVFDKDDYPLLKTGEMSLFTDFRQEYTG